MKGLRKIFHIGSTHDPNRSHDIASTSYDNDHRPSGIAATSTPANTDNLKDYFMSEEEFQINLAMAISASNSEIQDGNELDDHAIKKCDTVGEDVGAAEAMSRRYWDYNVVDYDEKILDGFYDIYGFSVNSTNHKKMPSFVDLQTSIGDLGYEVIIVNHAVDPTLVELEQIVKCISLDFKEADVEFLVQRISELVAQHMGGSVDDSNDMLAKWIEKSTELRTSQQTSLFPIGCINIGLSRHRSLLFKILADNVGIPCKLVKGSHYTGVDEDAVNIIKFRDGREFLVDLMSSPGILLPADAYNSKDSYGKLYNGAMNQKLLSWEASMSNNGLSISGQLSDETETSTANKPLNQMNYDPDRALHVDIGSCSSANEIPSTNLAADGNNAQNVAEPDLFSELNPFQTDGVGKNYVQFNHTDSKNIEYSRRREKIPISPGKFQPLLLKNRYPCNLISNTKINNMNPSKNMLMNKDSDAPSNKQPISIQSPETCLLENIHRNGLPTQYNATNELVGNDNDKYDRNNDIFIGTNMLLENVSSSALQSNQRRNDPMFDDVSECEIPWEHLVIGERIGLGSYGEVYHADWNGTEVAVKKFLDQDFYGEALDEFRSEVRIMRRLRHPNIVQFLGAVTRPPNLSIVSEFLPRGSLYKILHRPNCQIDEKRRIKMARDVAKGMNCLHTSMPTIVHRDLKSPNLLVDKNWTVKVCDFGLSRLKHSTFLSSKSTAGTPEWMAPEVLRNEKSNEKCDVYSFGVILWELATLKMPWKGMNPMQVVGAVGFQKRRLEIPKEVDPLVAQIIWECWQTDPNLRPSFAQLNVALKSLKRLINPAYQESQNTSSSQGNQIDHATQGSFMRCE